MNTFFFICSIILAFLALFLLICERGIGGILLIISLFGLGYFTGALYDEQADEEKSIICSEYKIEMIEITRTTDSDTVVQYMYKIHYKE